MAAEVAALRNICIDIFPEVIQDPNMNGGHRSNWLVRRMLKKCNFYVIYNISLTSLLCVGVFGIVCG